MIFFETNPKSKNIKARFTVDKGKEKEKSPEDILAENIDDSMLEIYDE